MNNFVPAYVLTAVLSAFCTSLTGVFLLSDARLAAQVACSACVAFGVLSFVLVFLDE